jgi:hypothetical protein
MGFLLTRSIATLRNGESAGPAISLAQKERQDNHQDPKLIEVDAPDAGTGPFQGTVSGSNNPANAIMELYVDQNNVLHGFLLTPCQEGERDDGCCEQQEDAVEGNSAPVTQLPSTVAPANPALNGLDRLRSRFGREYRFRGPATGPMN